MSDHAVTRRAVALPLLQRLPPACVSYLRAKLADERHVRGVDYVLRP